MTKTEWKLILDFVKQCKTLQSEIWLNPGCAVEHENSTGLEQPPYHFSVRINLERPHDNAVIRTPPLDSIRTIFDLA